MKRLFQTSTVVCCFLLLLAGTGCGPKEVYYPLVSEASDVIPYTSGSTFTMQDSSTREVMHFTLLSEPQTSETHYGHRDNRRWLDELECYKVEFACDNPDYDTLAISLTASMTGTYDQWFIHFPHNYYGACQAIPGACPFGENICANTDTIGGIVYANVIHMELLGPSEQLKVEEIWYNPTEGLLKLRRSDGEVWELLP